jgi:acyl-CoA synthetase (AMP-forming)/AMP-acid ligase II
LPAWLQRLSTRSGGSSRRATHRRPGGRRRRRARIRKRGETVRAWVVKKPGDRDSQRNKNSSTGAKSELAKPTNTRAIIEFRDQLPRTTVGKVLKRELVQEYKEKQSG